MNEKRKIKEPTEAQRVVNAFYRMVQGREDAHLYPSNFYDKCVQLVEEYARRQAASVAQSGTISGGLTPAEVIADILDRYDLTCPLEHPGAAKEINEYVAGVAPELLEALQLIARNISELRPEHRTGRDEANLTLALDALKKATL